MNDRITTWIVTGEPGAGKSTLVNKVINQVRSAGYTVGGITTNDIRSHGERTGFELLDLTSLRKGVLASRDLRVGPKMGAYRVNLIDLSEIASKAIIQAISKADLIVCDELGPMELLSPEFRRSVKAMIGSKKPILCSIHKRINDPLVVDVRSMPKSVIFEVTNDNRDVLVDEITNSIIDLIRGE